MGAGGCCRVRPRSPPGCRTEALLAPILGNVRGWQLSSEFVSWKYLPLRRATLPVVLPPPPAAHIQCLVSVGVLRTGLLVPEQGNSEGSSQLQIWHPSSAWPSCLTHSQEHSRVSCTQNHKRPVQRLFPRGLRWVLPGLYFQCRPLYWAPDPYPAVFSTSALVCLQASPAEHIKPKPFLWARQLPLPHLRSPPSHSPSGSFWKRRRLIRPHFPVWSALQSCGLSMLTCISFPFCCHHLNLRNASRHVFALQHARKYSLSSPSSRRSFCFSTKSSAPCTSFCTFLSLNSAEWWYI